MPVAPGHRAVDGLCGKRRKLAGLASESLSRRAGSLGAPTLDGARPRNARPSGARRGAAHLCAAAGIADSCAPKRRVKRVRWEQGLPPLQNGRAARWPEANSAKEQGPACKPRGAACDTQVHRWAQVCSAFHACGMPLDQAHPVGEETPGAEEPCGYDPDKAPGADALQQRSRRRPRVGLEATAGRRRSAPLRANLRSADVFRPGGRISRIRPR